MRETGDKRGRPGGVKVASRSGKLRELRFRLGDVHQRITYWLAPDRRVVLLTVFRKTKMREQAEVQRAHAAQRLCEAEHKAAGEHDRYSRDFGENR
ncbi:type II toxin-antitoxin system RelE/ParE family toxin [Streptomyces sp. NBC_00727]